MDIFMVLSRNLGKIFFLWILFEFTSAQDACTYAVYQDSIIIQRKQGLYNSTLSGVATLELCEKQCCTDEKCSAAMFKDSFCVLVDCREADNCAFQKKESSGISLITAKRVVSTEQPEESKEASPTISSSTISTTQSSSAPSNSPTIILGGNTEQTVIPSPSSAPQDDEKSEVTAITPITNQTLPGTIAQTGAHTGEPTATVSGNDVLMTVSEKPEGSSNVLNTDTEKDTVTTTTTVLTTKSTTTVPTTKSTVALEKKLTVSTSGNQETQLPKDSVTIHATVSPVSADKPYEYQWKLLKHPEDDKGTQSGIETDTLHLASLTVGHYEFKVEVTGENAFGEAFVNVTVLAKLRVNKKPVAIISPSFQELTLPTDSTLLDGSKSHDDDGIVKYEWEEVQGPLQASINKAENGDLPNEKVLKITGLTVGNYTFKLTVTDSDKVTDSTQAIIVVNKKVDNPPIANAGSNQVIHLPQNSAVLCGNDSTDDWGIINYKWSLSPDSKNEVVDMQGARSQCLELSNLEVGDYTFQLTVTDEAMQEDTAKVTIIVQPESNNPPVANAGEDQQLLLPLENGVLTANLDGIKSKDDKQITTVLWEMTSGPQPVTIVKDNILQTSVTGIAKAGKYVFALTVSDEDGASSTDSMVITVKDEQPPMANAGPDITLTLPDNIAMLDGSKSTDDYGIKNYEWTRTDRSPAAGYVLNHSDHQAVLHVAGLVSGQYTFVLKVTNVRGKSSTDETNLVIQPDPRKDNLVELHLIANIYNFDESQKLTVVKQLELLLSLQSDDEVILRSIYEEHGTGHMVILFYVKTKDEVLPAMQVADSLNSKLKSDVEFLEFKFIRADTYVCENLCSGHGRCHAGSHECECEMFWMENFLRVFLGDGKRNCDWSVLYVGIVAFVILAFVCCSLWFLACCCLSRRERKLPHKRRKNDKARYQKLPMKPFRNGHVRKNGYARQAATYKTNSIMRSISSSSTSLSESDDGKENTIFEKERLLIANGGNGPGYNGGFLPRDANAGKKRKSSSSSIGRNSNSGYREFGDPGFGHKSTVLRVDNSSQEDII